MDMFHNDRVEDPERGFIHWRYGTGANVELLHLRAREPRVGHGRWLLTRMLEKLREHPPYHTVYGFCLASNETAQAFYAAVGFALTRVQGVYLEGSAVVFSAPYVYLCELHGVHLNEDQRPITDHREHPLG